MDFLLNTSLTVELSQKRITKMELSMSLTELPWWQNQRNDLSGQPLLVFPSMGKYIFRSAEFKTFLLHRYLIPNGFGGYRCDCAEHPQTDDFGVHVSCGCNKEGRRTRIHDALNHELHSIVTYWIWS